MSDCPFSSLWSLYKEELQNFLAARTRTKDDAEDLMQELFIRAYKQLQTENNIEHIKPWLYRVAKNLLIDYYRKKGYQSEVSFPEDMLADMPEIPYLVDVKNSYAGLDLTLNELSPEYAKILRQTDLKGVSVGEYAERENLSINTAKSKLRRARLALREKLLDCCDFHFDNHGNLLDYTKK